MVTLYFITINDFLLGYNLKFFSNSALQQDSAAGGPYNKLILQTETGQTWESDDDDDDDDDDMNHSTLSNQAKEDEVMDIDFQNFQNSELGLIQSLMGEREKLSDEALVFHRKRTRAIQSFSQEIDVEIGMETTLALPLRFPKYVPQLSLFNDS
jgi:hypothetical protein